MAFYYPTSEPSFCTWCHEIKPYVDSWQSAPHSKVKCHFCHEYRGFAGKLDSKFRGTNHIYRHLVGQYTVVAKGKNFESNCIDCHLGGFKAYPDASRMDKRHYALIKEGRSCLECHRETGHKAKIFDDARFK